MFAIEADPEYCVFTERSVKLNKANNVKIVNQARQRPGLWRSLPAAGTGKARTARSTRDPRSFWMPLVLYTDR